MKNTATLDLFLYTFIMSLPAVIKRDRERWIERGRGKREREQWTLTFFLRSQIIEHLCEILQRHRASKISTRCFLGLGKLGCLHTEISLLIAIPNFWEVLVWLVYKRLFLCCFLKKGIFFLSPIRTEGEIYLIAFPIRKIKRRIYVIE